MKVHIKGKGQVDLSNNDYLGEGGQGKIYAKGKTVYKIYHEPKNMIPVGKIGELSALTFPNIIKPEDVLVDAKGKAIGYTMPYITHTHPICQVFTKAFKQREAVKNDQIVQMVRRMQETLHHIHEKKILIVDLNEMNFLASEKFDEVYFLDVDSYQTPGFPATALMESVRDRHSKGYSKETDYFALGIVTFQLFIGIHPYKGKHASVHDMDTRMQRNLSVLNKEVTIPAVCYPFATIPKAYLDWYTALFEKGMRIAPPTDLQSTIAITVTQKIVGSNAFDIAEIAMFDGDILNYHASLGVEVVVTESGIYHNRRKCKIAKGTIGYTPKQNRPMAAYMHNDGIEICDLTTEKVLYACDGKSIMQYEGRIYIQGETSVCEILPYEAKEVFLSSNPVANILEKATQMFDGVVIQNLLGSHFVSVFPKSGHHQQISTKEISGYTILDAKFESGVLMIVGNKQGKYDRFIFRFGEDWSYDLRVVKDVVYGALNFTVLDNGVCVCMTEEEMIEIFSVKKDSAGVKVIDDVGIDGNMKLFHSGTRVMFAKGNKIYSLTMRTK
jgi:serine/threonine protein kinase